MPALETTTWAAPLRRSGRGLLLFARAQPLGALALVAILLMFVAGVFARLIAPADPVAIDFTAVLSPPSAAHPFGTDNFGRAILTRIIFRHMLPNVMAPFLIMLTAFIAQAILLEASLSFLGLGVSEPTPAWGLMLAGNAVDFYREAPWIIIFPGLAISVAVFAFNFLGDSLRDWLHPRFRA